MEESAVMFTKEFDINFIFNYFQSYFMLEIVKKIQYVWTTGQSEWVVK